MHEAVVQQVAKKRANLRLVVLQKHSDQLWVAHMQDLRRMRPDETCLSTPHRYWTRNRGF
jgi:hypothetical protein